MYTYTPFGRYIFILLAVFILLLSPFLTFAGEQAGGGGTNSYSSVDITLPGGTTFGGTPPADAQGGNLGDTGSQTGNQGNQTGGTPTGATDPTVTTLLGKARGVLDALIPFIIGLAVFVIIWGIFIYITHAAEEEKRAEAKQFIIYGILGVFFMISIWGFVTILINTFSVEQRIESGDIPTVPEIRSNE